MGRTHFFLNDRWILGQRIEDLCPLIHSLVPKWIANTKTVATTLDTMSWIRDIYGVASIVVFEEFLQLWDLMMEVDLQPTELDKHYWRLSANGKYSTQSAYEAIFQGSVQFEP